MRYLEFKDHFNDFLLFSLLDIRKIEPAFNRRRLHEWKKKGYIRQIINGYYIFKNQEIDDNLLYYISNRIYQPSYVSLEAALAYFGFIPEAIFAVTAVSTRKTKSFSSFSGNFIYKHLAAKYFFGYDLLHFGNMRLRIATPEKAILDFLYLNPHLKTSEDFSELRFNPDNVLEKIAENKMAGFLKRFDKKSLQRRTQLFLQVIKNA